MNPSTEDIVKAIEQVNAKNVIILPNNKNIFMAAQSAAEVVDVNAALLKRVQYHKALQACLLLILAKVSKRMLKL